jgi:hypothetical protein
MGDEKELRNFVAQYKTRGDKGDPGHEKPLMSAFALCFTNEGLNRSDSFARDTKGDGIFMSPSITVTCYFLELSSG